MKTVGQILSIGRNSKNLSISDISVELNISKSIIIDLENDNIKNNPDIIFNIGHLRSYSNFLDLDTDIIIDKFKNDVSFNIKKEKKNITPIVENNFFKIEKFFAASLILIIFTSFYFLFINKNDNEVNFALARPNCSALSPALPKCFATCCAIRSPASSARGSFSITFIVLGDIPEEELNSIL